MADNKPNTKPPTGLQITRAGETFTFSWAIGDANYDDGQKFRWDLNGVRQDINTTKKDDGIKSIGKTQTSVKKTVTVPNMKKSITFAVQGNRKKYKKKIKGKKTEISPKPSEWIKGTKTELFHAPPDPDASFSLESSNVGVISWWVGSDDWRNNKDSSFYVFTELKCYTGWTSNSSSSGPTSWDEVPLDANQRKLTSGSWRFSEDSSQFQGDYSYTRWFKVVAYGPVGSTQIKKYVYHTYALPRQVTDITAKLVRKTAGNGYMCDTQWKAEESFTHPIETTTVQYAIGTPHTVGQTSGNKYTVSWYPPNNLSWNNAGTVTDTTNYDALRFSIDNNIEDDQLVYVRANTQHDDHVVEGKEEIAYGETGTLPLPTNVVVNYAGYSSTHRISVSADNDTNLEASYIAVYFKNEDEPGTYTCIGVLPYGTTTGTFAAPIADGEISIGTEIILGDYEFETTDWGTQYNISTDTIKMRGKGIKWEESVTLPPEVHCRAVDNSTIHVSWSWNWKKSNQSELSWSDHEDAWQSTDPPQSYIVDNIYAGEWNIKGLDVGTWYVRVRLLDSQNDLTTVGLWSDTQIIKLSSAPAIPSLELSESLVTTDGEVTCYWGYVSTDGTPQLQANICEATIDPLTGKFVYGEILERAQSQQSLSFLISKRINENGWAPGDTRYLAVKVISGSGESSTSEETDGWSIPAAIKIADPIVCSITSTSDALIEQPKEYELTTDTNIVDGKTYYTRSGSEGSYIYTEVVNPVIEDLSIYYEQLAIKKYDLIKLPLSITVEGAGLTGKTILSIERDGPFHISRPDENDIDGFDKETVFIREYDGEGTFEITAEDITGFLDDRANYTLTAVSKVSYDEKGVYTQTAEDSLNFTVNWQYQATVPIGRVTMDPTYNVAIITPDVPEGTEVRTGDVCDIYRLSIDRPQLIYKGAIFGDTYVDPYPTIGDYGGYRLVYRTVDGDYTTGSNIAWFNTSEDENNDDSLNIFASIIDFGNGSVSLPYNLSLNSKWSKDFQQTSYLGGHIQGDWNPAVVRTGTINSVGIVTLDEGTDEDHNIIEVMRELAIYPGVCNVRTPDGSNYAANINVTEDREEKWVSKLAKYTLDITRVDNQSYDAMPYSVWQESLEDEEENEG